MLRLSRTVFAGAAAMLVLGIILCQVTAVPFVWVFGPPLIFGAIVAPVGNAVLIRKWTGSNLVIDSALQTVTVTYRGNEVWSFPFDRVIAFQYLESPERGGQVNLVVRDQNGDLKRYWIYAHLVKAYARRVARRLAAQVPWPVIEAAGECVTMRNSAVSCSNSAPETRT
jgi:hypothetical protein